MSEIIYQQLGLPAFQNMVYADRAEGRKAALGDVELVQSQETGLVFNRLFGSVALDYDEQYQNEQACSSVFRQHLDGVLSRVLRHFGNLPRGIEIGCGKGYFLDMLLGAGAKVTGYDPAYQGNSPFVRKAYYRGVFGEEKPDYIILRHVLEHIQDPWGFLALLASGCKKGCRIYIEVPCFDWIVTHSAFYDVFYEHCNYFTLEVLNAAFGMMFESERVFDGQYLSIFADLSTFQKPDATKLKKYHSVHLLSSLPDILSQMKPQQATYVWGAGAKGMTFSNILYQQGIIVDALIDINPAKQGRFVGMSGIPIESPGVVKDFSHANVIIMNPIYADEIAQLISCFEPHFISAI